MGQNTKKMVLCSQFAALMAVCAWLSIPLPPLSFTLQSFGMLLTLGVLGGRWGAVSIAIYLLLGLVGLPVFSGFRGGAAAFLDPTGGFLWGFLLGAAAYRAVERFGDTAGMIAAQLVCYLCGCLWFCRYAGVGFWAAAGICVAPYLLPDAGKLLLARKIARRIRT